MTQPPSPRGHILGPAMPVSALCGRHPQQQCAISLASSRALTAVLIWQPDFPLLSKSTASSRPSLGGLASTWGALCSGARTWLFPSAAHRYGPSEGPPQPAPPSPTAGPCLTAPGNRLSSPHFEGGRPGPFLFNLQYLVHGHFLTVSLHRDLYCLVSQE